MTVFASRTRESLNRDPLPWKWIGNKTGAFSGRAGATVPADAEHAYHGVFDPRPEYTPTRDPQPWRYLNNATIRYARPGDAPVPSKVMFDPRPEFDTPVNPVLSAVRDDVNSFWAGDLAGWLSTCSLPTVPFGYLAVDPDELDHAEKVLTRLKRLCESREEATADSQR